MQKVVYALFFLAFVTEDPTMFGGHWKTFMGVVDNVLFDHSFLKLPFFFYISAILAFVASGKKAARAGRVAPMDRALWVAVATMVVMTIYGALRGGAPWTAGWQLFPYVTMFVFSKLLLATMRTPAHFMTLGKLVVAAGLYRAFIGTLFYVLFVRDVTWGPEGPPPYITTHADSALFAGTIAIVTVNALERRTRKAIAGAFLISVVMLGIIQLNNRRIAFLEVAIMLMVVYGFLPKGGAVKRKVNRAMIALVPVLAVYVVVGWGRPEKIFKPVRSLSSMNDDQDSSTQSRKAENNGLVVTLARSSWLLGTGWGHEYIEVDNRFSVDQFFKQWRSIPHNSILGILAFSGAVGFLGVWIPIPVAVFLNGRTRRFSRDPQTRIVSLVCVSQVPICMAQMFGDMGFQSQTTLFLLASGFAAAGRLPIPAGAWGGKIKVRERTPKPPPARVTATDADMGVGPSTRI